MVRSFMRKTPRAGNAMRCGLRCSTRLLRMVISSGTSIYSIVHRPGSLATHRVGPTIWLGRCEEGRGGAGRGGAGWGGDGWKVRCLALCVTDGCCYFPLFRALFRLSDPYSVDKARFYR
jgi:hypothetical protein